MAHKDDSNVELKVCTKR